MAVVENAVGSLNRTESHVTNDIDPPKSNQTGTQMPILRSNDQNFYGLVNHQQSQKPASAVQANGQVNYESSTSLTQLPNGNISNAQTGDIKTSCHHHQYDQIGSNGLDLNINGGDDGGEGIKKEIRDLEEMLSKLNPMAEEFVPTFLVNHGTVAHPDGLFSFAPSNFVMQTNSGVANGNLTKRKKYNHGRGKRRINSRTSVAQRDDVIRRTVYVSDIDHQVTEEQLATLFISCGQVVDCRVCGDPTSVLHFAFIEFTDEEGARNALSLAGTMLGYYPVRVLPSKTAIAPVNPTFLPRSEDEREMCARTIYCTNIDRKVTQSDVRLFFESFCGEVNHLRLLGDHHHSTLIAFVEFVMAESAIAALNCSGAVLGSLPIRVSPSKTPVRPRTPQSPIH